MRYWQPSFTSAPCPVTSRLGVAVAVLFLLSTFIRDAVSLTLHRHTLQWSQTFHQFPCFEWSITIYYGILGFSCCVSPQTFVAPCCLKSVTPGALPNLSLTCIQSVSAEWHENTNTTLHYLKSSHASALFAVCSNPLTKQNTIEKDDAEINMSQAVLSPERLDITSFKPRALCYLDLK